MAHKKTTTKVVSFKLLSPEYEKLLTIARKTGVKVGPIVRGLLRKALENYDSHPNGLISLIKIGQLFSNKK